MGKTGQEDGLVGLTSTVALSIELNISIEAINSRVRSRGIGRAKYHQRMNWYNAIQVAAIKQKTRHTSPRRPYINMQIVDYFLNNPDLRLQDIADHFSISTHLVCTHTTRYFDSIRKPEHFEIIESKMNFDIDSSE